MAEAEGIARPIFSAIRFDAARICRTASEADTCRFPSFQLLDESNVNAYAGFDSNQEPTIAVTRGLVEHLAEQPEELAFVISHEYGHLIAAHNEEDARHEQLVGKITGTTLGLLAATSMAMANSSNNYYGNTQAPVYSQSYISEVTKLYLVSGYNLGAGVANKVFSKGQEHEADYIGTYLAVRNGYTPNGSALLTIGSLGDSDNLTKKQKLKQGKPFAFWDSHPNSAQRVARVRGAMEEIVALLAQGFEAPLPPRMIAKLQKEDSIYSLQDLSVHAKGNQTVTTARPTPTLPFTLNRNQSLLAETRCEDLDLEQIKVDEECRNYWLVKANEAGYIDN